MKNCNYCGQVVDHSVVVVTTGDRVEYYCGIPEPTKELSCWQQIIRNWYWSITPPPTPPRAEHQDGSPSARPVIKRLAFLAPTRTPPL
jgi:hypothetical protein